MSGYLFKAIWPIRDPDAPAAQLADEVRADLPAITLQARAKITGPGRFYIAPSWRVPGSGGVTDMVLVFECPAEALPERVYHRRGITPCSPAPSQAARATA